MFQSFSFLICNSSLLSFSTLADYQSGLYVYHTRLCCFAYLFYALVLRVFLILVSSYTYIQMVKVLNLAVFSIVIRS